MYVQPTPAAVCSTKADVLLQASDGKGGLERHPQWLLQAVWVAGCCLKV
jgi:hypothetical protein